ncbi:MAG: hypothetical protein ACM31E_05895 [Fibrobacterota bacterium]|nr:hypothetical protein [Chitinispirillaceae bacterium]
MMVLYKSRKYTACIICIVLCILLVSCGIQNAGSGSEAGNSTRIAYLNDSLFLKLPSSATGDSAIGTTTGLLKANVDPLATYYSAVRGYIGFANDLVHDSSSGLKHLIRAYRDSIPWAIIEKQKTMSGTFRGAAWVASYDETRKFVYQLNLYVDSQSTQRLAFVLAFNGLQNAPAGKAYYRMDLLEPQKVKHPLSILVEFTSDGTRKQLDLELTSEKIVGDSIEGFRNLKMKLLEQNNVLHFSGASFHPSITTLLPDTNEYCYQFYGFADTVKNQSVLYIGIPPASINSDAFTYYNEYDLSSVLMKKIIRQDLVTANDTIKRIIVTSYTDTLSITAILLKAALLNDFSWLEPVDKFSLMTLDNFRYFLEINRGSTDTTIVALNWLSALKQPVYFTGSGYAGNGGTIPQEFSGLAASTRILSLQNPYSVKMLVVSGLTVGE